MPDIRAYEQTLNLNAERLSLEFANTVSWHASVNPIDHLGSYADLVAWARQVGLLTEPEAERLLRQAARRPDEAQAVLEQAREWREALYRILAARANEAEPDPADVAVLNDGVTQALAHARLVLTPEGFGWDWDGDPNALDQMLWPVLHSAVDLLTAPDHLDRVGQCADDRGCGWLFLDLTKNRSRRWCDMKDCGNRAKARRHYARQRGRG